MNAGKDVPFAIIRLLRDNESVSSVPTTSLSRSSLVGEVHSYLQTAISAGEWQPGDRIPEAELATRLGVSRTPIREALRTLAGEGLVEAVPLSGYEVRRFTVRELLDIFQVRTFLEGEAACRAAERMSADDVWHLQWAIGEARRFGERQPGGSSDEFKARGRSRVRFHELVLDGSESRILGQLVSQVMVRPAVYRALHWYTTDERRRSDEFHAEIFAAIRDRDGDAARALMSAHVEDIGKVVISGLTRGLDLEDERAPSRQNDADLSTSTCPDQDLIGDSTRGTLSHV